tara:strand:+ start:1409 stop:4684 length:3276 start_codon:yes stop_codon:yes gene_type:complete
MSAELLEQLKIKPNAEKQLQLEIKINPEPNTKMKINTTLIDETNEKKINRDEFIKNLNKNQKKKVTKKKESVTEKKEPAPKKKKIEKISTKIKLSPESKKKRKTEKKEEIVLKEPADLDVLIEGNKLKDILPKNDKKILFRANAYYMNNRKNFINFINALFNPFKKEFLESENQLSCDKNENNNFSLLTHQKIVRDYLNIYTPYRGLLLFHGLGSGKTCSSIAIAEGMKNDKQIVIMTPASLRVNYLQELKYCGDPLYKTNQPWEFFVIPSEEKEKYIFSLSQALSLSPEFIKKNKLNNQEGVWIVNTKNKSNSYNNLNDQEKDSLDKQINEMMRNKYKFINYNGLRMSHLKELTSDFNRNPFDNKVIIIDEAHNFVSRIVNKLKKKDSLSYRLYEYLMSAENCKIVFLSGTPIINYPNEISILFNILRGYIKTWTMYLNVKTSEKINLSQMKKIFEKFDILDFIDYKPSSSQLTITRNPYGFINMKKDGIYKGVSNFKTDKGEINDEDFIKIIVSILKNKNIEVLSSKTSLELHTALPTSLDEFENFFIDANTNQLKNQNLFKRRILGLTSYFRSAQEQLMPKYNKDVDFKVIKIPMSDYQFGVYEQARIEERKLERSNRKKKKKQVKENVYEDTVSTYRIFSRAFCNFVFPNENPRPMPDKEKDLGKVLKEDADEDLLDAISAEERINNPDGPFETEDIRILENDDTQDSSYKERIKNALDFLKENASTYLSKDGLLTYSPKFLNMLENIQDENYIGLHMIYSQFRTLEGIGILKLILEENGFTQFKIKKNEAGIWNVNIKNEDKGKPTFALYTGTEDAEEKEIIRNIYNSDWEKVPVSIVSDLSLISSNNYYGEIIKVLMISASGAEGISLKNVRYVHITEPYWHPVRVEQVIGRARRICSHHKLLLEERTVEVFLYLMKFTEQQLEGENAVELKLNDGSKFDDKIPVTSDETLYEISSIKEKINKEILTAVKESSIDCSLYTKGEKNEKLNCFSFGKSNPSSFSFGPSLNDNEVDAISEINEKKINFEVKEIDLEIDGIKKKFAMDPKTKEIYDFDSIQDALNNIGEPVLIGKLQKQESGKYKFIKL